MKLFCPNDIMWDSYDKQTTKPVEKLRWLMKRRFYQRCPNIEVHTRVRLLEKETS